MMKPVYYDDTANQKALYLAFVILQIVMLLIVYGFVYSAFVVVKIAVDKYGLTFAAYMPVIFGLVAYPVALQRTRKMFRLQKRLRAVACIMAWASEYLPANISFLASAMCL